MEDGRRRRRDDRLAVVAKNSVEPRHPFPVVGERALPQDEPGRRRLPTRKDKVERPGAHVPVAQLVLWYLEVDAPLDGFPQETKFVTQAPDFIQQIFIIVVLAVADVL